MIHDPRKDSPAHGPMAESIEISGTVVRALRPATLDNSAAGIYPAAESA